MTQTASIVAFSFKNY